MSSNNGWTTVKPRKQNNRNFKPPDTAIITPRNRNRNNETDVIDNNRKHKTISGSLKFWITSSWLWPNMSYEIILKSRLKELKVSPVNNICNLWTCLHQTLLKHINDYAYNQSCDLKNEFYVDRSIEKSLLKIVGHYKISVIFHSFDNSIKPIIYRHAAVKKYEFLHLSFDNFLELESGRYSSEALTAEIIEDCQKLQEISSKAKINTRESNIEYGNLHKIRNLLTNMECVDTYEKVNEEKKSKESEYYEIYSDEKIANFTNTYECTVYFLNPHAGRATPIRENNLNKGFIDLKTRRNCGYNTFQNDRVLVKINDYDTETGQVIKVLESSHRPVNGIFICKVCHDQTNLMKPLDGSIPKIHVDNEPGIREYEKKLLNNKENNKLQEQQYSETEKRIQSKEYGNYKYVSIYSISSVNKNHKTVQFKEHKVIEIDPENCPYLFIVVYVHWDPFFMYPQGKVVGTLNVTDSINRELQLGLIATICHVEPQLNLEKQEMDYIQRKLAETNRKSVIHDDILPSGAVIFTIDSETTKDMDDAISYHVDVKTQHQIVGVHISDVTHYLPSTFKIYEKAKRQATTFYPSKKLNQEPIHMLNEKISTQVFSLLPNKPRRVVSVYFQFPADVEGKITNLLLEKPFIREGCIISQYRLNYKDVAKMITRNEFNDEDFDDNINEDLLLALDKCYEISKKLRRIRLPDSYFVRSVDDIDLDYIYSDESPARFLIEEFMLLANQSVAQRIYGQFPDNTLLRCQPVVSDFKSWFNTIQDNLNLRFSGEIKQLSRLFVGNPGDGNSRLPLTVSRTFLEKYREFIKNGELDLAKNMLFYDMFYNDFYVYLCDWYKISHKSRYICSVENDKHGNRHFQLNMDHYTHFTSPIRRFTDIIVHRLLKQVLQIEAASDQNNDKNPPVPVVNEEEIKEVCTNSNRSQTYSKLYEKYCESIGLFQPVIDSNGESNTYCFILDCACSEFDSDEISFVHPLLRKCFSKSSIRFSHLGGLDSVPVDNVLSNNGVQSERLTKCLLSWKRIIYTCWPLPENSNVLTRNSSKGLFIIPSNIYDATLNPDAYKMFRDIRRDYLKDNRVPETLKNLSASFITIPPFTGVTSDSDQLSSPIIEIRWELNIKNTIRLQFCRHTTNGLNKVLPELFIVCDTFQVCLLHSEDPIKCFALGGELKMKYTEIKKNFDNLEDYKDYFLPLVEAESLTESLKEHISLSLVNCEINFVRSRYKVSGTVETFGFIVLDEEFCKSCNIMISDFSDEIYDRYDRIIDEAMNKHGSDLLCLRGKRSNWNNYWVGHGQVLSKASFGPPNKLLIVFLLTQSDFPVSTFDFKEVKFNVDFYTRSIVSRRQIQAINNLDSYSLLNSVILGSDLEIVDHKRHDFIQDVCYKHKLNVRQEKAVRNALSEKLSLIWGPPGTGKTSIGCILSKVYSELNTSMDSETTLTNDAANGIQNNTMENEGLDDDNDSESKTEISDNEKKGPGVVLYCGPSNDCVDLVAREMKEKFSKECPRLLRIYGESQELADFPVPGVIIGNRTQLTGEMQQLSLHHLIRESSHIEANAMLKNFDDFFASVNQGDQNRSRHLYDKHFADKGELLERYSTSTNPSIDPNSDNYSLRNIMHNMIIMYRGALGDAKKNYIKTSHIQMVLCTTSVSATKIMDNFNIKQVIIDEAGMCKEPETLIPIIAANESVEHIVMIGDHKQLRPIIHNKVASSRGLQISLFERYQSICPHLVTMLNFQYRMHPSICEFPSVNFYNKQLITSTSHLWSGIREDDINDRNFQRRHIRYKEWNGVDYEQCAYYYKSLLEQTNYSTIPDHKWPGERTEPYNCFRNPFNGFIYPERVVFINVIGDEISQPISTSTGNENSKANEAEVKVVKMIYEKLLQRFTRPRQAPSFVTVLTQYKLQESKLLQTCKNVITELGGRKSEPKVQTVIRSQGSENDYIIFSTVRSLRNDEDINKKPSPGWEIKYLGFITDPNQINVALTRAKKGLIIVGNKKLLRVNSMWGKLIGNLEKRGCVLENVVDFHI